MEAISMSILLSMAECFSLIAWILALACCEKGMVEAEVPTAEDGLRAGTTGGGEETKSGKRGLRGCEGGVPLREFLTKEG
ncbi:hypothetical protein RclHR1_37870001 [Rhizophagus clarus]|uniref:Secreted protein n=1 Tax=Rhizophagus clarus TaxID=94130 RepID=A0A2Z6RCI5_9GLOM|nr:hypothetical protein RclHR1_37870001 [Rhizophagus clarus]